MSPYYIMESLKDLGKNLESQLELKWTQKALQRQREKFYDSKMIVKADFCKKIRHQETEIRSKAHIENLYSNLIKTGLIKNTPNKPNKVMPTDEGPTMPKNRKFDLKIMEVTPVVLKSHHPTLKT